MHSRGNVQGTPRSLTKKAKTDAAEKAKPATDKGMASMAATQQYLAEQSTALTETLSINSKKIDEFREGLKDVVAEAGKRVRYEFDIKRGKDKLLDKIIVTPIED
jgi:coenzyme F420-reducing hydrogenase alpha subunit